MLKESWKTCPMCGSANTTQTAFDGNDGYNAFTCNNCGTRFGN